MFLLVCITFQVEKSIQLCLLYFKQLQIDSKYLDVFIPEPRIGLVLYCWTFSSLCLLFLLSINLSSSKLHLTLE